MTQKSGLQMIEEMLNKMSALDRRMQVVETNLKLLLNSRSAGLPINGREAKPSATGVKMNDKPAQAPRLEAPKPEAPKPKAAPNSRVIGRIKGEDGKAVPNVSVTIYDARNNAVKRTKTNRAGDWMAFLPPGKYGAECILEGRVNENVIFTVSMGDKIVRVSPPR